MHGHDNTRDAIEGDVGDTLARHAAGDAREEDAVGERIPLPRLRQANRGPSGQVRGCFWHQHGWEWNGRKLVQTSVCPTATRPKSNCEFWDAKFRRNVCRDAEHEKAWAADGWNLIVVWECALKTEKEREKTFAFILRHLERWAR